MPSISFNKGKDAQAIAVVRGGELNGSILYINMDDDPKLRFRSEVSVSKYMSDLPGKPAEKVRLMKRLQEALGKNLEADDLTETAEVKAVYKRMKDEADNGNEIKLPAGSTFEIVPNPDPTKREVFRCSGMSGSGKSYFARSYAENYHRLFPDRPIYLFSELTHDETLDNMKGIKPKRISLDKLVEEPIKLEEFDDNPCLCLFDDVDALEKKYSVVVNKLIDDLVSMGRHKVVSVGIMTHHLSDYKKSRLQIAESNYIILFPQAVAPKAMRYICENYCGMDIDDIKRIRGLGRWVCIHKTYPPFVLSAHEVFMLNK